MPVTFVLEDGVVWFAVDHKPKRVRALKRLANIEAEPRVALLVDTYDDDWSELWWVRADGEARIATDQNEIVRAAVLLGAKYPQYETRPPAGPAVEIRVQRWSAWSAAWGALT